MAIVLPLFLLLVLGMIEAARLGMAAQLITTAAREGCRVAVLPYNDPSTVQTQINGVLAGSGISPTMSMSPVISSTSPSGGTPITVTLSVPYSQIAWFSPVLFFGGATVTASATMSSERP